MAYSRPDTPRLGETPGAATARRVIRPWLRFDDHEGHSIAVEDETEWYNNHKRRTAPTGVPARSGGSAEGAAVAPSTADARHSYRSDDDTTIGTATID